MKTAIKQQGSKKFELDTRNLDQVFWSGVILALSVYASNTEAFNALLGDYVSGNAFVAIVGVLSYLVKKFVTDYSQK